MISKRIHLRTIRGISFNITPLWIAVFFIGTYLISRPVTLNRYLDVIAYVSLEPITTPPFSNEVFTIAFAVILFLSLYLSVILHELGHVYGALKHDIAVRSVTLWVLGGAAEITDRPETPREEFELTIAGPLVSFTLGIIALTLAYVSTPLGSDPITAYFFIVALLNLGMMILNLIPAFPLDGGRILRSVLATMFGQDRGTIHATRVGKLIAVGFAALSIVWVQPFMFILSAFVFLSSRNENKRARHYAKAAPTIDGFEDSKGDSPPDFTGNTFVFETDLPSYTVTTAAMHIQQHGGTVANAPTDAMDYLVVPEDELDMYTSIADHHDAQTVSAGYLDMLLDRIPATSPSSKPDEALTAN